jgi:hypothetical protein
MKRVLLQVLVIVLVAALLPASGTKLTIAIHGNYLTIADDDFKAQYGGKKIFPEGKVAVTIFGNVYLWGELWLFPGPI